MHSWLCLQPVFSPAFLSLWDRMVQKKGTMGKPDQKDLNENMAATQALSHMITGCKKLFQVWLHFSSARAVSLSQGSFSLQSEEAVEGGGIFEGQEAAWSSCI